VDCLEDERSIIQQVLEESNTVEDAVAVPVQLRSRECFTKEANHTDFAVGHHENVSADAIIGGIS